MTPGVRTEWHLAELSSAEADPFQAAVPAGITIDLNAPEEVLFDVLGRLLGDEGRLWAGGVRCDLKDAGQDCRSCQASTQDPREALSRLCKLGKDEMAVAERSHALHLAPVREIAAVAEECSELGHLEPGLVEWLTGVGL